MNSRLRRFVLVLCGTLAVVAARADDTDPVAVVQAYFTAFNAHDIEALAAGVTEDFAFFAVTREEMMVEVGSRAALKEFLQSYFDAVSDVHSVAENFAVVGNRVSFKETVSWTANDGTKRSASSLAVYEIRDGLISACWYY